MANVLGAGPTTNEPVGSANTIVITQTGCTAGRSLVIAASWASATATITSATCSGETVVIHGSPFGNGTIGNFQQFLSVANIQASGDKTITINLDESVPNRAAYIVEVAGGDTSNWFDGVSTSSSGSGATASVSRATSNNNAAIFVIGSHLSPAFTPGSGYTGIATLVTYNYGEYDIDVGAAGSKTADFAGSGSQAWSIVAASFNAALPVTKSPGVGSLVFTGQTALAEYSDLLKTPTVGALGLSGKTATLVNSECPIAQPSVGSLVLTGNTASVSNSTDTASGEDTLEAITSTGVSDQSSPMLGSSFLQRITGTGVGEPSSEYASGSPSLEQITGVGYTAVIGAATLEKITSTGSIGNYVTGSASLAAITGLGYSGVGGTPSLQTMTSTGIAEPANFATGGASLKPVTGVGYLPVIGSPSLKAITSTGAEGNYTYGSPSLEAIVAYGDMASGYASLERIQSFGFGSADLVSDYRTKVMNTRTGAVTEYHNYEFNSYAFINGSYYGASDTGLYRLSGTTDNGANIDWSFRTGQLDDKTPYLKRLPEIILGLRANGPVRVRVWKDDNEYYDYTMPATKIDTIHQQRVVPGKGMRSRYYSIEVQSLANSTIELDSMQLEFAKTSRRIG